MLFNPQGLVSPLTNNGDIFVFGASTNQRLPAGSDNLFLMADSSVTLGLRYTSPASVSAISVTTITSSVTLASTADVIFVNGGTFTITLPNPASFLIKPITITRTDNAVTLPIYINGLISGSTNWAFYTQNETLKFVTNGSAWVRLQHDAKTELEAWTPTTFGFGAIVTSSFMWCRDGEFMDGIVYWTNGTVTADEAGIVIPMALRIDTNKITRNNTDAANGVIIGNYAVNAANDSGALLSATGTSTTLIYFGNSHDTATQLIPQVGSSVSNNGSLLSARFRIPILGWKS